MLDHRGNLCAGFWALRDVERGKGPGSHRLWGMAEGLEVFILSRLGGGGVGSPEICRTVVWSTKQMCSVYSGRTGVNGQ